MSLDEAADSRELLPGLEDQPGYLLWRAAAGSRPTWPGCCPRAWTSTRTPRCWPLAAGTVRSQQSVADTVDVSRTTMTKVAAALVEQGLVERVRNPGDRRSYLLTRTPEGAAAARRWHRHAEDVEDALTEQLSLGDREELRRLLLGILDGSWSRTPRRRYWTAWVFLPPAPTCA